MVKVTPRTLADWTPDGDDVDAWLAQWAAAGWVPEYTWAGSDVVVNGRTVHRFDMIPAPRPQPVTADIWAGALAGFGACLVLW